MPSQQDSQSRQYKNVLLICACAVSFFVGLAISRQAVVIRALEQEYLRTQIQLNHASQIIEKLSKAQGVQEKAVSSVTTTRVSTRHEEEEARPAPAPAVAQPERDRPPTNEAPLREISAEVLAKCVGEENINNIVVSESPLDECDSASFVWKAPAMSLDDRITLYEDVRKANVYVEFGITGATSSVGLLAKKTISIDHNLNACWNTQAHPAVQYAESRDQMRLYCVETGVPTNPKAFGRAICGSFTPEECASKHLAMLNTLDTAMQTFANAKRADVVLVDGRFKVACALKALQYADEDTAVYVHDWRESFAQKLDKYYHIDSDAAHRLSEMPLARLTPRRKYHFDQSKAYEQFLTMDNEA